MPLPAPAPARDGREDEASLSSSREESESFAAAASRERAARAEGTSLEAAAPIEAAEGAEEEAHAPVEETPTDDETEGDERDGAVFAVSRAELARHATEDDCWVALYGEVYDFTEFLEDHPAGAEAIYKFAGKDGTEGFDAVHSPGMLEEFEAVGTLVD